MADGYLQYQDAEIRETARWLSEESRPYTGNIHNKRMCSGREWRDHINLCFRRPLDSMFEYYLRQRIERPYPAPDFLLNADGLLRIVIRGSRTLGVTASEFYTRYIDVTIRTARRSTRRIEDALRRWIAVARARVAFRPGGVGYLQTRRNFLVNSGQSRATRRYSPY